MYTSALQRNTDTKKTSSVTFSFPLGEAWIRLPVALEKVCVLQSFLQLLHVFSRPLQLTPNDAWSLLRLHPVGVLTNGSAGAPKLKTSRSSHHITTLTTTCFFYFLPPAETVSRKCCFYVSGMIWVFRLQHPTCEGWLVFFKVKSSTWRLGARL